MQSDPQSSNDYVEREKNEFWNYYWNLYFGDINKEDFIELYKKYKQTLIIKFIEVYKLSLQKNNYFNTKLYKLQCESTILGIVENIFNNLDSIFPFIKILGAKIELQKIVNEYQDHSNKPLELRGGNKLKKLFEQISSLGFKTLSSQKRILSSIVGPGALMNPNKKEITLLLRKEVDQFTSEIKEGALEQVKHLECDLVKTIQKYEQENLNSIVKDSYLPRSIIENYFHYFCIPVINNLLIDFSKELFLNLSEHFPELKDLFYACHRQWELAVRKAKNTKC